MRIAIDPGDGVWLLMGRIARAVLAELGKSYLQVFVTLRGEWGSDFRFRAVGCGLAVECTISRDEIEGFALDLEQGEMGGLGDEPGVREGVADWMWTELANRVAGELEGKLSAARRAAARKRGTEHEGSGI